MQEMKQLILVRLQKKIPGPYCCGKGKCNTMMFKHEHFLYDIHTHIDVKIIFIYGNRKT